jgi:hypothetical protein
MTTTTIDEVIYCGESWSDLLNKHSRAIMEGMWVGDEVDDHYSLLKLAHERYKKALTAYESQQSFEDTLEAQIAEEIAELMGDPR